MGDEAAEPGEPVSPGSDPTEVSRRAAAHVFVADIERPELTDDDRRHLVRALRLRAGEVVTAADGAGGWRRCRLVGEGELEADGAVTVVPAPTPLITVAMAVPKGDRAEWAIQKLTEIGVDRIVLLSTARGIVRWEGERAGRHLVRLAAVARGAAMQSRRMTVPVISGPVPVATMVSETAALAEPGGGPPSQEWPTLLVGPEGGWSPDELEHDVPRVTLGPAILRTETAATVGAALLVALRTGLITAAPRSQSPPLRHAE